LSHFNRVLQSVFAVVTNLRATAVITTLRGFPTASTRPNHDEQAFIAEIATLTRLTDAASYADEILLGMVAEVDMLSAKHTDLGCLIAPVVRVKETAFTESEILCVVRQRGARLDIGRVVAGA